MILVMTRLVLLVLVLVGILMTSKESGGGGFGVYGVSAAVLFESSQQQEQQQQQQDKNNQHQQHSYNKQNPRLRQRTPSSFHRRITTTTSILPTDLSAPPLSSSSSEVSSLQQEHTNEQEEEDTDDPESNNTSDSESQSKENFVPTPLTKTAAETEPWRLQQIPPGTFQITLPPAPSSNHSNPNHTHSRTVSCDPQQLLPVTVFGAVVTTNTNSSSSPLQQPSSPVSSSDLAPVVVYRSHPPQNNKNNNKHDDNNDMISVICIVRPDHTRLEKALVRINNEEEYMIVPYPSSDTTTNNNEDIIPNSVDETADWWYVTLAPQDYNHENEDGEDDNEEYDMDDEILDDDDEEDEDDKDETIAEPETRTPTQDQNHLRGGDDGGIGDGNKKNHNNGSSNEKNNHQTPVFPIFPLELFQSNQHPNQNHDSDVIVLASTKDETIDKDGEEEGDDDDKNKACLFEHVVTMGVVVDSLFCQRAAASFSTSDNNKNKKNKNATTKPQQQGQYNLAQLEWAATQEVMAIVEATNLWYQPLCIRLEVGRLDLLCDAFTDPIAQFIPIVEAQRSHARKSTCGPMLHLFRHYYVQRNLELRRDMDIVHLFHGHDDGSLTLGCAIPGHVCNRDDKSKHVGISRVKSSMMGEYIPSSLLIAHETAHTLGSRHDRAQHPDNSIMYPKFRISAQRQFTPKSQREIFQTLKQTKCVARVPVGSTEQKKKKQKKATTTTTRPITDSSITTKAQEKQEATLAMTSSDSPNTTTTATNAPLQDASISNSTSTSCSHGKLTCWFQQLPMWTMGLVLVIGGGVMTLCLLLFGRRCGMVAAK